MIKNLCLIYLGNSFYFLQYIFLPVNAEGRSGLLGVINGETLTVDKGGPLNG